MIVLNKNDNQLYEVFDIKYKSGNPMFLVYKNSQWTLMNAQHFVPVDLTHNAI